MMGIVRRLIAACTLISTISITPAAAICILGVGSCIPSDAEAQQALAAKLQGLLQNPITIQSFQKTNGMQQSGPGGQAAYSMSFVATVSYAGDVLKCRSFGASCLIGAQFNYKMDQANKTLTLTGWLNFQKTEQGWASF
jgi:hypothetical protein